MKRIVIILLAIMCGVAFSDGYAKKPKTTQKQAIVVSEQQSQEKAAEEMAMPCSKEAQSDDKYYKALGISQNELGSQEAIVNATRNAQIELAQIAGENIDSDKVEIVCRKVMLEPEGTWRAFVAIRYPKSK